MPFHHLLSGVSAACLSSSSGGFFYLLRYFFFFATLCSTMEPEQQQLTKKQRKELRRQERREEAQNIQRSSKVKKITIWSIVILLIVGGGWLLASGGGEAPAVTPDIDPFKGSETAKVVVTEFSDFQCPACQAALPVVNQVIDTYGDRIKFVYTNFPLPSHQNSDEAARASECAFDQGKFWELHDILFATQDEWGTLSNPKDKLTEYASQASLDTALFGTCYDSTDAKDRVDQDKREATAARVNSTPTFIINGEKIVGAQPFSKFQELIDAELAK